MMHYAIVYKKWQADARCKERRTLAPAGYLIVFGYCAVAYIIGRTPYERFVFEFGEDIARKLGIVPIPLKDETLRPCLVDMN